jgi:hypothetical protein
MLETKKKEKSPLQAFTCEMRPVPPGTKRRGPRPLRGSEWAIPPILVQIVATGLRRIQALGQNRNPERCAIEAAHLQSLPALLLDFDPEVLDRYWNAERIAFMQNSPPEELTELEPMWKDLAEVLQECKDEHAAGTA